MDLRSMIVRDGVDVATSGVVLDASSGSPGRVLLMPDYLTVTTTDIPEKAVLMVAADRLPDPGTNVDLVGALLDGVLYPHAVTRIPGVEAHARSAPAHLMGPASSPDLQEALASLVADGVVTTFWLDGVAAVFWVASTDPDDARRRLDRVVLERLQVVPSRWTAAEIHAANLVLDQMPRPLVLSRGEAHGDDHQLRLRITVRNVTEELATLLEAVPIGLLEVTTLIRPSVP